MGMFRIRRIHDITLPRDARAMTQVQEMLYKQFPGISKHEVELLPEKITNPFKDRFRYLLLVAEEPNRTMRGFALISHDPELKFSYLDYMAASFLGTGAGIGSVLYETVREESLAVDSVGVFFECLPDDPALCVDPLKLKQNIARLKFYERYRARPIINTRYETPLSPTDDNPPYLVFDDLDQGIPLSRDKAKSIIGAILERKYKGLCPPEYNQMVLESVIDDPIRLRDARYVKEVPVNILRSAVPPPSKRIALVVNSRHSIHHVRSRGYVESPVRVKKILDELRKTELFKEIEPWNFPEKHIRAVHDRDFVYYLKKMYDRLKDNETIYPYVFPIRNQSRRPEDLPVQVGYYCIDTFTPLNKGAYLAARAAVDCSLTAAETILDGNDIAYALVRPPGHHAERDSFGGFCYFNNCAIAAHFLSAYGKVAILDIDYHHGNGQQDIFYDRSDVLTISIHGHPRFAYPYFTGFEDESGEGEGRGYNLNIALPEQVDGERYRIALVRALKRINNFKPRFLVVALGVDTAKGDPTGSWTLESKDFELNGRLVGQLKLPTLVVQEGGYKIREVGKNVLSFLRGLWTTKFAPGPFDATLPQERVSFDSQLSAIWKASGDKKPVVSKPVDGTPSAEVQSGVAPLVPEVEANLDMLSPQPELQAENKKS